MSDKSSNPMLSDEQAREAQEWAKQIHESQVAKGLRPADGEPDEKEDIVEAVKEVVKEVIEKVEE